MIRPLFGFALLLTGGAFLSRVGAAEVDFGKEIYPVLQRACFECHGAQKKKGGLRLDTREEALKGGESGAAIAAGRPEESELLRRVTLPKNDEDVMPNRGARLTPAEIGKIHDWIASGAVWPESVKPAPHWSYLTPVRPALPAVAGSAIDAVVRARLEQEGLRAAPPAEPLVLARRLYLDLIGLPPTPEEADAFEAEARQNLQTAVERLADRLLASPQYGEKWARPWLDLARYADSHGFQRDDLRDLWPYRDWVIRALNADMPFDQFSIEQLAGDLLPNATEDQKIATGFNRCAACNVEAGTEPEENRVNQIFDRVATVGAIWLGSTVECAQCHDHKYDPITQRDYYGLFSFFNQTALEADRAKPGVKSSIQFIGPYLDVSDPARNEEREKLQAEATAAGAKLRAYRKKELAEKTEKTAAKPNTEVLRVTDFESAEGASGSVQEDGSVLLGGDPPATDTYTVTASVSLQGITGFKLEAMTDPSLPGEGPGRGDPQRPNFVLNHFSITAAPVGRPGEAEPVTLASAFSDFAQKGFEAERAIGPASKGGWAVSPAFHQAHWAIFRAAEPVGFAEGTVFTCKLVQEYGGGRTLGRVRLTALTGPLEPERATGEDAELARLTQEVTKRNLALRQMEGVKTLVMQEVSEPRPSTIFKRGDFRSPGDAVDASTPAALHAYQEEGPKNRLALAKWLVSRENPLAARAYVNRIWTELFGEGIVSTPEDFGLKGEAPSNQALLDLLAVDFMDHGWSPKQLLREIVTSATYRQDSRLTAELKERDPLNRLLARGPRFRLSAEAIRDNALSVCGLFNPKPFGPPIYPPQPKGLWDKVGGKKYEYETSAGDEQYRRGLYVILKRSAPYPSFVTFDATARLACRVQRVRSNTPLQALTLLNDPVYVEAAQALAARVSREEPTADVDARLRHAFRLALIRPPSEHELSVLRALYQGELAAGGQEEAAWVAVTSALLNLDETITKT